MSTALTGENPEIGAIAGVILGLIYMALLAGLGIQLARGQDVA